jgi:hypothetical protein
MDGLKILSEEIFYQGQVVLRATGEENRSRTQRAWHRWDVESYNTLYLDQKISCYKLQAPFLYPVGKKKKKVTGMINTCTIFRGKTHFAPKCFPSLPSDITFGWGRAEIGCAPQSFDD